MYMKENTRIRLEKLNLPFYIIQAPFLHFSRLLGGHNWYSLGFFSSWPASLAAIFLERPSRRGALSIYVCYVVCSNKIVWYYWQRIKSKHICLIKGFCFNFCLNLKATEAILETYRRSEMLPNIPGCNSICFGALSSVLIYVYRKKQLVTSHKHTKLNTKHASEGKDVIFSLLRLVCANFKWSATQRLVFSSLNNRWKTVILGILFLIIV